MKKSARLKIFVTLLTVVAVSIAFQNCSKFDSFDQGGEVDISTAKVGADEIMIEDLIVKKDSVPAMDRAALVAHFEDSAAEDEASAFNKAQEGVKAKSTVLWPGGILYYRFYTTAPNAPTTKEKDEFKKACAEIGFWANLMCYEVPSNTTKHHVVVYTDGSNETCGYSYLGLSKSNDRIFNGTTYQWLKVGRDCWFYDERVPRHELMHAFGMMHEQQHYNAPTRLTVFWDNINPAYDYNFVPLTQSEQDDSTAFNYSSVMQYPSNSFAPASNIYTLLKKGYAQNDPAAIVHRNTRLSLNDHNMLVMMYGFRFDSPNPTVTQAMYDLMYEGRIHLAERDCNSAVGKWHDCFRTNSKVVSVEPISVNSQCDSNSQRVSYKPDGQYFVVGDGCSGRFRIRYQGSLSYITSRTDRAF